MSTAESTTVNDLSIQDLVTRARKAQSAYELFKQEQVDAIVRDIGKYVYDNAENLARMAVDETEMGSYDDKVLKNKGKARVIWNNLKNKKSRGVIGEDSEANLVMVAKPMGVVAAVTPVFVILIVSLEESYVIPVPPSSAAPKSESKLAFV